MRRPVYRRGAGLTGDDGYTLTEMLVVIGIICLLAAILTPALLGQLDGARARAAKLQLDTVSAAVEQFRSDVGRYPTKAEGLTALRTEPQGAADTWTGPYLKDQKMLSDPWGRLILYAPAEDGSSFYVESLGSDGKPGGSGVNRDIRSPAGP